MRPVGFLGEGSNEAGGRVSRGQSGVRGGLTKPLGWLREWSNEANGGVSGGLPRLGGALGKGFMRPGRGMTRPVGCQGKLSHEATFERHP